MISTNIILTITLYSLYVSILQFKNLFQLVPEPDGRWLQHIFEIINIDLFLKKICLL